MFIDYPSVLPVCIIDPQSFLFPWIKLDACKACKLFLCLIK